MASTTDPTSHRFTASDLVSDVTEALQRWRNAEHTEQAAAWRKYQDARRRAVDLIIKGLEAQEAEIRAKILA